MRPVLEQREILHVAGADLNAISIFSHQVERLIVNGLGHNHESKALTHLRHDLQGLFAQTLECIGRRTRLIGSAAEEPGAGFGHALSNCKRLLPRLNGTRAGNDAKIACSKRAVRAGEADHSVFFLHITTDQFVRLAYNNDFLHTGHFFQRAGLHSAFIACNANGRALAPGMACARYPRLSIRSHTARTCSSLACAFMTTNISPDLSGTLSLL